MQKTSKSKNRKFRNPFHALRHGNFKIYWLGMCVSLIGTWMQNIAQPWLALTLTNSPFKVSLVGTLQFVPILIFSLFSGVLLDKVDKRKLLIATQALSAIITGILAFLSFTGLIQYWHLLVLAFLLGVVNSVDLPARQTVVVEMVGREDLMNAIALNSMAFNLARVLGPSIAGIVLGISNPGVCFLINSISFLAVVGSLLMIQIEKKIKTDFKDVDIFKNIKDGVKYAVSNRILLISLTIVAIVGTFAPNYNITVPVFSREVLKLDGTKFGLLMSCLGVGSLLGSTLVASLSGSGPRRRFMYMLPLLTGLGLIMIGFTDNFYLTGICLAFTGFCQVAFTSTANSTVQLNADDEYRGRVMSLYTLIFAGSTPFGNLFVGVMDEKIGARYGLVGSGLAILILIAILYIKIFSPLLKERYRQRKTDHI